MIIGLSSFDPLEERDAPEYLELVELYNRILPRRSSVNGYVFCDSRHKINSSFASAILDTFKYVA